MRFSLFFLTIAVTLNVWAYGSTDRPLTRKKIKESVSKILDQFHEAAAKSDKNAYFGLLSKNAIFLGTDAKERWTKAEFNDYAKPHFDSGKGWTFKKIERFVYLSKNRKMAWFDERLASEKYGECRGSGVLVKERGKWKVVHFNLAFPVPNSLAKQVVSLIRGESKLKK